jgi:hypothetical protein
MLTSAPVGRDSKFTFCSEPHIIVPQPVNKVLKAQQPMNIRVELVSFITCVYQIGTMFQQQFSDSPICLDPDVE